MLSGRKIEPELLRPQRRVLTTWRLRQYLSWIQTRLIENRTDTWNLVSFYIHTYFCCQVYLNWVKTRDSLCSTLHGSKIFILIMRRDNILPEHVRCLSNFKVLFSIKWTKGSNGIWSRENHTPWPSNLYIINWTVQLLYRQYPGAQSLDSVNWQCLMLVTGPLLFKWRYHLRLTCKYTMGSSSKLDALAG